MDKKLTYNKQEKLKSRKLIEQLFSGGQSIQAFPIKALYKLDKGAEPLKAGVVASKRSFKKAVHRNRIKRLLRETYRLQKLPLQELLMDKQLSLTVFFIFNGRELPVYGDILEKMRIILEKLQDVVLKKQ